MEAKYFLVAFEGFFNENVWYNVSISNFHPTLTKDKIKLHAQVRKSKGDTSAEIYMSTDGKFLLLHNFKVTEVVSLEHAKAVVAMTERSYD